MDIILANVSVLNFKIERDLKDQIGAIPLPFVGMDKSMAAVCQFLDSKYDTECDKGNMCPFRHIRGDRTIVCKHWLRGLCKKGDQCEFLHEYDMKKMPECYFYSRFNACHNKECPFLHIDPESKVRDCPWYDRGFCRHGPHCRHRHVRRVLCVNYLAGFCEQGWNCKYMHPCFDLPPILENSKDQLLKKIPICHYCGELGHKASVCKKNQEDFCDVADNRYKQNVYCKQQSNNSSNSNPNCKETLSTDHVRSNFPKPNKPLDEITCYKCGTKGHYANKCPKGHLAFLSNHNSHK